MSRAIDKRLKEALKQGDHAIVYEKIADALALRLRELLEIEFLAPSHALPQNTYFLQDGNALAIPKLSLLQAFIPARRILQEYRNGQGGTAEEALRATAVILLLDPEHLTAANTRKRILLGRKSTERDLKGLLQTEMYFIDSLLTSRLHRHTKSPTLWGHRQWLLERCKEAQVPLDVVEDLTKVVFISAERHPRNYYAWSHARYLARGLQHSPNGQKETLAMIAELVKKWCLSHHNDTSGWSFLTTILARQPQLARAVFSETLQLTEKFRWRNESVWYFLRHMLLCEWVQDGERDEFEKVRLSLLDSAGGDGQDRRVLEQAGQWVAAYCMSVDSH